ncbi:MAG: pilus assembly protein PilM [Anaerohalosphaera sp.]|nr:pilus assembly protein PilM [Anaerohalosphaera sp.]
MMFDFLKKRIYPIGIDLGTGHIKMAQLGHDGQNVFLNAAACQSRPDDIEPNTGQWQRWVASTVKQMVASNPFKGKALTTAMPCADVFIDQVRVPASNGASFEKAVFEKVRAKLPFDPAGAMVKYVVNENSANQNDYDVVVMVAQRQKVEMNLAIYEKAGLQIKSISIWPLAISASYSQFFGRRQSDAKANVLLLEIGANHSNIVIARGNDLRFARAVAMGSKGLETQGYSLAENLIAEATSCCRYFESVSGGSTVEKLVFLARQNTDPRICQAVADFAQTMQLPAQIGDVFAAVDSNKRNINIDERLLHMDWSTAFGLSLASVKELQSA